MKTSIVLTLALILALLLAGSAFAHLEAGEDRVVNGYLIDFGYEPAAIVPGLPVTLALNLVNQTTDDVVAPHNVWVRISQGDDIYFAGYMYPEADHVSMLQTFPHAGNYTLTTRFQLKNGQKITTDFSINVIEPSVSEPFPSALAIVGISGLFVGIVLTALYLKR